MRDSGGITLRELEDQAQVADADLPLMGIVTPILLPVALITLQSLLQLMGPLRKRCIAGVRLPRARAVPECRGEKHRAHAGSHDGHFPSLSLPGQKCRPLTILAGRSPEPGVDPADHFGRRSFRRIL